MKIDSMDASNFTINTNLPAKVDNKDVTKDSTVVSSVVGSKNISQMTQYDINELPLSEKTIIEAIQKANKAILGGMRKFEFSIHQATKQIMVKVIDSDTNEVIREIPPEKVLDMVAKMWEMAGVIVDEKR